MAWSQAVLFCAEGYQPGEPVPVQDARRYVTVACGQTVYTLDKARGTICSVKQGGEELLAAPCDLTTWRALTDNELRIKQGLWDEHMHKVQFDVRTVETEASCVKVQGVLAANGRLPLFQVELAYLFTQSGVEIKTHALRNEALTSHARSSAEVVDMKKKPDIDFVLRFGMRFHLKKQFEQMNYLGFGPYECYIDLRNHCRLGLWQSAVSEQYEPYIMPQECGNHVDVRWLSLSDGKRSVHFDAHSTFEASALHHSIEALDAARHTWELPDENVTDVLICCKNSGVGSHSCGPVLDERYRLNERELSYTFRFSVENQNLV